MAEVFCDILPHPTGWIYQVEGSQSPVYPSRRLAVEAASCEAKRNRHRVILREQDLKGRMKTVESAVATTGSTLSGIAAE